MRTIILVAVVVSLGLGRALPALPAQQPLAADRPRDFTPLLEVAELLPAPVAAKKDAKSGFVVGGKNATALLGKLTEINGRAIAALETDMRPTKLSKAGFLGPDEKLLDILAADNRYVVDELGLTHQQLARHLHALGAIGDWLAQHDQDESEFRYHGKRFKTRFASSANAVDSPFADGTRSGANVLVTNVETGKTMRYGLLVPHMMERYGFYEGQGTPYRLEPRTVVQVLGFLRVKKQ